MRNKFLFFITLSLVILVFKPLSSQAFTRIVDLVFNGMSVSPSELESTLAQIKKDKSKKTKTKDKLSVVYARQANPKNIQLEIDTSEALVKSKGDVQAPISNQAFLDVVTEAENLWAGVDIANVKFKPIKFASGQANPEDGKNIITFRAIQSPEGVPAGSSVVSIITYARTKSVLFMNKAIMVKPGTILDADVVFDPTNDPCLAIHTTQGDFVTGGSASSPAVEGGVSNNIDPGVCPQIFGADLTDLAVSSIGSILGLDSSAIASAATSTVALIMARYALTNDDKIGLANIYPNHAKVRKLGSISGRITLDGKPVRGAHVVLENRDSGEPVCSTITDLSGRYKINAVPPGIYNVYAEPLDGPIRKSALPRNFFGFTSDLNFSTGIFRTPVVIKAGRGNNVNIPVKELSASAFNINFINVFLTESDISTAGSGFLLPIRIMAGETLTNVMFWGDNISTGFGTPSISGMGITFTNVQDASIPISPNVECQECTDSADHTCNRDPRCPPADEITKEADQVPGFTADITCDPDTPRGPRNIIFKGDQLDITSPSFGLIDQISGGIIVVE